MKKAMLFSAACLCAVLLYSSCHKKGDGDNTDCRTCKAYNLDFQLKDSAVVCSDGAEATFRNNNTGRQIECK